MSLRWVFADTWTLTLRALQHWARQIDLPQAVKREQNGGGAFHEIVHICRHQ